MATDTTSLDRKDRLPTLSQLFFSNALSMHGFLRLSRGGGHQQSEVGEGVGNIYKQESTSENFI